MTSTQIPPPSPAAATSNSPSSDRESSRPFVSSAVGAVALALAIVFVIVLVAVPRVALALPSAGHGVGHLWRNDNLSWLGTYRMADGRLAFCLEAGKPSPVGNDYTEEITDDAPGLGPAETARLAYISRMWAATGDADTAAAAQLAVWTITGLNGHTQRYYAGRANERAEIVLGQANAMLGEAEREASTAIRSGLELHLDDDGTGWVTSTIDVQKVTGAWDHVPDQRHGGVIDFTGAHLDTGENPGGIANGQVRGIQIEGSSEAAEVTARVRYENLPYGRTITVASSPAGSQRLLYAAEPSGTTSDETTEHALLPLPFQPRVVTRTSEAVAAAGTDLRDDLHVDVAVADGALTEWGHYPGADGLLPIPVTVRSTLLGPFPDPIVEADERPEGAPEVCTVETWVVSGPGDYTTPSCTLPAAGFYVWVESIDAADTPVDQGRDRVRGWKSRFGVASEVTRSPVVPTVPRIRTTVDSASIAPGECAVDELLVENLAPSAGPITVESLLLGPFTKRPADGADLSQDGSIDHHPVAGTALVTITADGSASTPCVTVNEPGHYVFVFRSEGSDTTGGRDQVVAPFADFVAHDSESIEVVPPEDETPPTPAPLAFTGADGLGNGILAALGALLLGGALLAGTGLARVVRRRREAVRSSRSAQP